MFIFPPCYVAFCASKAQHRLGSENVSWCLETSLFLRLPSWDRALSFPLLSLFLSFIFFPTSFWRQRVAFLGAWCPLPAFRSCFVEFSQRLNVLLMNLWGRKWSPVLFLHHLSSSSNFMLFLYVCGRDFFFLSLLNQAILLWIWKTL